MLGRYSSEPTFKDDSVKYYDKRKLKNFNLKDATLHIYRQSDTLDNLAYTHYNDSRLWWVFLEANRDKYMSIHDIVPGSKLIIPSRFSVMEVLNV